MAQIVHKIPYQLSGSPISGTGQYRLSDNVYDFAIAGIPFLSAIKDDRPYMQRMAEIKKQQFDNFAEPGEQTLQGWWLRSQSSFTGGAGVLYQDPDNDNQFNFRFADSLGVDPWTSGNLSLLRSVVKNSTAAVVPQRVQGFVDPAGDDAYWVSYLGNLDKKENSGTTSVVAAGATIYDLTSTGTTYIIARANGSMERHRCCRSNSALHQCWHRVGD